ncbi:MAG TPA: AAA family ATPase [Thermoanaerobaculia bacterium]|nr:AAA family ATPase [Thermoanaerobaculia bacterium]
MDREREAFVPRTALLGELERQILLSTGCPGLLVYGRRRMGKSTLLRNLPGLLPPGVQVVQISMQRASAFNSLPNLLERIGQEVAAAVPDLPAPPVDLTALESFLAATDKRLDATGSRLLLALDEYENLDRKIGEGVFSEDLLSVLRESIQTHRHIIWTFAGSHAIDELTHAPWTSYLVSARTLEVTPFEPAETRLLLTEPLQQSSLWNTVETERPRFEPGFWGESGIERIQAETGGWPHLVQLVAETVIDLLNDTEKTRVDEALLERALDRAVVRGNNVFSELVEKESRLPGEWDYLCGFRSAATLSPPADLAIDRSLRRRRLVLEEDGRFRLRAPLMARWLRQGP